MDYKTADFSSLAYVLGEPEVQGVLKDTPEDFLVEEVINYPLTGEGEHLWCWVEKCNQNTDWVAGMLAKWAGCAKRNVGFAGLKDRFAITRQWFSIQLPGKADPNPDSLNIEGVRIIKMQRHNRKLQRGGLAGNRFTLNIKNLQAGDELDVENKQKILESVEERLEFIKKHGMPNYFGTQRFGRGGNNLIEAQKLIQAISNSDAALDDRDNRKKSKRGRRSNRGNRNQQSLYISALRSWMFNELLSERVKQHTWKQIIDGDVVQLEGSSKWFVAEQEMLPELEERACIADVHPTGALFGDGDLDSQNLAKKIELLIAEKHPDWCAGLADLRIQQARRPLRVMPLELQWSWTDVDGELQLALSFMLPAGSFATMLVRELLEVNEPVRRPVK